MLAPARSPTPAALVTTPLLLAPAISGSNNAMITEQLLARRAAPCTAAASLEIVWQRLSEASAAAAAAAAAAVRPTSQVGLASCLPALLPGAAGTVGAVKYAIIPSDGAMIAASRAASLV